ncbi:MAG: hypothetical protein AAF558_04080 [Verrucomicrobiota bacterium]
MEILAKSKSGLHYGVLIFFVGCIFLGLWVFDSESDVVIDPSKIELQERAASRATFDGLRSGAPAHKGDTEGILEEILGETDLAKRLTQFRGYLRDNLAIENAEYLFEKISKRGEMEEIEILLSAWSQFDPEEAYCIAFQNLPEALFESVCSAVIKEWVNNSPEHAEIFFKDNPLLAENGSAISILASNAIRQTENISDLSNWIEGWQCREVQKKAKVSIVVELAKLDPQQSGQLVLDEKDPQLQKHMAIQLISGWADCDPQSAVNWVSEAPAHLHEAALSEVFAVWASYDPHEAGSYLNFMIEKQLSVNSNSLESLDQAHHVYSMAIANEDLHAAVSWGASIEDPNLRNKTLVAIFETWHALDYAAAQEVKQNYDLD